jgi:hypothetical protein
MSRFANCLLVLAIVVGCKRPDGRHSMVPRDKVSGAEEPEQLAERFFRALQTNDVELALTTIPTEDTLRKHFAGDSDLPHVLAMTSADDDRLRAAFAKIRQTFKRDGVNLRSAKAAHIKVDRRTTVEGEESFDAVLLGIEVNDPLVIYEIEFDDGMKLDGRWYFTDRIVEIRRIILLSNQSCFRLPSV